MHLSYNQKISMLFDSVKLIDQVAPSLSSPYLSLPEDLTIPLFPLNPTPKSRIESQVTILHGENLSEPNFVGLPLLQGHGCPDVIGTINGLVCLVQCNTQVILWNPATRKSFQVPSPCEFSAAEVYNSTYGFGLDLSSENSFKIVRITYRRSDKPYVEIYSYTKNLWRVHCNLDPLRWSLARLCCNVIFNGLPYWRAIEIVHGDEYYRELIVAFATCCDTFRVIELPRFEAYSWKLGVIGESLVILVQKPQQALEVLMHHDNGWKKAFSVCTMALGVDRWLGCLSSGELVAKCYSGDLSICSPRSQEIKYLPIRGGDLRSLEVFEYFESLVAPRSERS